MTWSDVDMGKPKVEFVDLGPSLQYTVNYHKGSIVAYAAGALATDARWTVSSS